MISESHKFIIITPPKTGSTSLVEALKGYIKIYDIKPQLGGATFDYSEVSGGQKVNHKHKKKHRDTKTKFYRTSIWFFVVPATHSKEWCRGGYFTIRERKKKNHLNVFC